MMVRVKVSQIMNSPAGLRPSSRDGDCWREPAILLCILIEVSPTTLTQTIAAVKNTLRSAFFVIKRRFKEDGNVRSS